MAKSKIIKDLVNNEVSLTVVLSRLYVLASDLENQDILDWANKEHTGYNNDDELPDYRILRSSDFVYTGINGSYTVTNQPLSLTWLNPETIEKNSLIRIRDSVLEIENKSKNDKRMYINRSYLAGEVEENTRDGFMEGVQCISIEQTVTSAQFVGILMTIKQIALQLLLELEKKFGVLDDLDVGYDKISEKERKELIEKIQFVFNEYSIQAKKISIKGSNIGDDNTIKKETTTALDINSTVNVNQEKPKKINWIKRMFWRRNNG